MDRKEKEFCLSVAGHSFAIHSLYDQVYSQCLEYTTEGPAEENITMTEADIEFEREEAEKHGTNTKSSYLETLAVYRKIGEAILKYDTFLMHGAVIAHEGSAYMFSAMSGTGKTTHIRKWLDNLEGTYVVNGDKPLIKIDEDGVIACGTPWCGKEKMGCNRMVPLKVIYLMERGENNEIQEISFGQAFVFLLQQTYMPMDDEKKRKTLTLLSQLKGKVKIYKFICNNMKDDAFDVAYKAVAKR